MGEETNEFGRALAMGRRPKTTDAGCKDVFTIESTPALKCSRRLAITGQSGD